MKTVKPVILASASQRRKELLEKAGIKFKIVESEFEEHFDSDLQPHLIAEKLSSEKAKAVYKKFTDSIIIAADTLVVCDGEILGKPKDEQDAKRILSILSGKKHSIITGFTIINGEKIITKSEETKVFMRKISEAEIDSYIATKEPFGKAGAYAIQGNARKFIEKIEGDLSNVIGLPIQALLKSLKEIEK
jgi:septum formation protein